MSDHLLPQARQSLARGDAAQAIAILRPALDAPPHRAALALLAELALRSGQGELAERALSRALVVAPEDPTLLGWQVIAAQLRGNLDTMAERARALLARDPGHVQAASLLVEHLGERLQIGEALQRAEACLRAQPRAWSVRVARHHALMCAGEATAASRDAMAALAQAPQSFLAPQHVCLTALYDETLPPDEVAARHRVCGARIPSLQGLTMAPRPPRAGRPLRLGFVSPDLRNHPVGWFLAPLLRELERTRFETVCYSDGPGDAHSARLRALAGAWHETRGRSDEDVFAAIQRDRIDVLVDLAGVTAGGRPRLFASRAAPVQLLYLGYPFVSGLAGSDGVIGDAAVFPPGSDALARETLLRLPNSFLCFEPQAEAPPVRTRPTDAPIRFGSFNHLAKLSDRTVRLWTRVLDAVPGATLTLCALGLGDAAVRARIASRFAAAGLDPARLDLRPPVTDLPRFLDQYGDIDFALDPLAFNGGTTTAQALWQGVPTITLPGALMPARMGLSLLRAAGLDEFIARDEDDYVAIAARWSADVAARTTLRASLRERLQASPLMDAKAFAADFGALIEGIARD